ncbi:spore germination protein GerPB [Paenibacillus sp. sgz500958]|uniref:spore germination protein GerPB n=1 Tax=Paenibacillus sp. sgz500958 TaxID=3242475 RepID=UPI0036D38496
MNISVYQCISINHLNVGNLSNSSVLQIGTSGKINASSTNNTSSNSPASPPAGNDKTTDAAPRVLLPAPALLYPR